LQSDTAGRTIATGGSMSEKQIRGVGAVAASVLLLGACAAAEDVGRSQHAVLGGRIASEPAYDAGRRARTSR